MNSSHPFYQAETYTPENSTGYLINRLAQTITREIDRRMIELGLTDAQWKPLMLLRQGSCLTATDLSRKACHDTGAVTRLLDRLENKGLIRRVRSEADRRVVNLELTTEGEQVSAEVPKILSELANQVLTGFSDEEFVIFRNLLNRALTNAQALSHEGIQS
jgi:DNA-binding MarR family transcriptional regulator